MKGKLPVFISIPHGGTKVPVEVKNRAILSQKDLFDDTDPFTIEIYNLKEKVSKVIYTSIARAFVDLNRAPDDLPPRNPDGVIKSHTCFGEKIYQDNSEPSRYLIRQMLDKYYFPYHHRIQKMFDDNHTAIKLSLDCHSMAAIAPAISPDKGRERPMICLGNGFNKTCPQEMIERMASCFRKVFSSKQNEVTLNQPFAGGYITKKYGSYSSPWIQVELNRKLYLQSSYFCRKSFIVNKNRLRELNHMFEEVLRLFFNNWK